MDILKTIALTCIGCLSAAMYAQEAETATATVEKSIFNVQTGPVGLWVSNESRLSNTIALRTEIGLELWTYDSYYEGSGTFFAPSISLEPRWYYNIEKRSTEGKHTANNSANFVTIAFEYFPDLFTVGSHPEYVYVPNQLTIIPKWGIRRAIAGSRFNYELGAGIGYIGNLSDTNSRLSTPDVALDLHARIGYTF
jgi:hypothetical protein